MQIDETTQWVERHKRGATRGAAGATNRAASDLRQRTQALVLLVRRYMEAVVRADTPPDFPATTAISPDLRDRLRRHREDCLADARPDAGLVPLRDCLLGAGDGFLSAEWTDRRPDVLAWEEQVWRPLALWVRRGFDLLFGGRDRGGWPWPISPAELRRWVDDEVEIEEALSPRGGLVGPDDSHPVVIDDRFSVRYQGSECHLGNTDSFRLLRHLLRHCGRSVPHRELRATLDDHMMSPEALRKAVCRVRNKLRAGPCRGLAAGIVTRDAGHVRLDVPRAEADYPTS